MEGAAVSKRADLPEEAVDATRKRLHVDHPRYRLLLIRLEREREAILLHVCAVAAVLSRLQQSLERKWRRRRATMA